MYEMSLNEMTGRDVGSDHVDSDAGSIRAYHQREHNPTMSDAGSEVESDVMWRHEIAHTFFDEHLANAEGTTTGRKIASFLEECGFREDDPRFTTMYGALLINEHEYKSSITRSEFISLLISSQQSSLLQRAFRRQLAVPEWPDFCNRLSKIFNDIGREVPATEGRVAQYIPCLSKIDPNLYGLSICTVDGQRFSIGNSTTQFCVQSACKPFNYGLALEEHGEDKVHQHIGREPSGVAFNSLCMNSKGLPHNPLINSGAIMACSLIKTKKPLYERFEHIMDQYNIMSGGFQWGFSNPVYLAEKATADQNQCLAYMMRKHFAEGADVDDTLDLYFQSCSLLTDCNMLAIAGSTLANHGICPLSNQRVFKSRTTRNMLSLMASCGMYDYSGEWAFSIGLPAKSGVSGCIFTVIPGLGAICTYAPPLDSKGNSVRGIEFFKRVEQQFGFHNFSVVADGDPTMINPRRNRNTDIREQKINALYSAAEGDLAELRRMLIVGVSPNVADYDGRTLLHLAASENHLPIVKFLVNRHNSRFDLEDRWGGTAYTDALKHADGAITRFFDNIANR